MAIGDGWADGAWVDAGWTVGAWEVASAVKTIGGTSQLAAFTASSGIQVVVPKTLGASSSIAVFTSSGGIQVVVPKTIGASSALGQFTSSGTIYLPDAVVSNKGGQQPTKAHVAKERALRKQHLENAARDRAELEKLFPSEAMEELAATGEVEINGMQVSAPKIVKPEEPAQLFSKLDDKKKELLTFKEQKKMISEEVAFDAAIVQYKDDLIKFEEEFAAFLMLALL